MSARGPAEDQLNLHKKSIKVSANTEIDLIFGNKTEIVRRYVVWCGVVCLLSGLLSLVLFVIHEWANSAIFKLITNYFFFSFSTSPSNGAYGLRLNQ